ncbi:unnamed protein product, partial [Choristocarpus tenellus]
MATNGNVLKPVSGTGFPFVLFDILKREPSHIVTWTSTGTAFGIRDMTVFRQDVLTRYFKHNKFSSFQRQLNLYGFRKVVKGRESGCYMHPSFLRERPDRLGEVKRGVVPPCPPHYSRKIYGSGPRFTHGDDGSGSEPELTPSPRGVDPEGHNSMAAMNSAALANLVEVPPHMAMYLPVGMSMRVSASALAQAQAQVQAQMQAQVNAQVHLQQVQMGAFHPQSSSSTNNTSLYSKIFHRGRGITTTQGMSGGAHGVGGSGIQNIESELLLNSGGGRRFYQAGSMDSIRGYRDDFLPSIHGQQRPWIPGPG